MGSHDTWRHFLQEEEGATSIEYALLGAMISVVMIGGMRYFGESIANMFSYVSETVGAATGEGDASSVDETPG